MRSSAFWDTSALVPILVEEALTGVIVARYKQFEPVVWWSTPVEISSALSKLLHLRRLSVTDWNDARGTARRLERWWRVIQPTSELREEAMEIVERYDLRAAASLQLAAALQWCEHTPQEHLFFSADRRLREAAVICGFDAPQL